MNGTKAAPCFARRPAALPPAGAAWRSARPNAAAIELAAYAKCQTRSYPMASVGRAQGSRHADPRSGRAQRLRAALSKVLPTPDARPLTCARQGDVANNIGPWAPTEPSPDSRAQTRTHTHTPTNTKSRINMNPFAAGGSRRFFICFYNVFSVWKLGPLYHRTGNSRTHGWDHISAQVAAGCIGAECHMSPRRHTYAEQLWSKGYSRGNALGARTPSSKEAASIQY